MTLNILPKLLYAEEIQKQKPENDLNQKNSPFNAQPWNLWQDMKIAVYKQSPSNLTAWAILPRQIGKDIKDTDVQIW